MKINRPLGFIRCKYCSERELEVFITSNTVSAICANCQERVFDIRNVQSFINESILRENLHRNEKEEIPFIN